MCNYVLYTKHLKKRLLEKLEELEQAACMNSQFEVRQQGKYEEISCFLEGPKEECDVSLANVLSDVIQQQAIIMVCKSYLKERSDLNKLEKRDITDTFITNNYLSGQEGFSSVTYYLVYVPLLQEIRKYTTLNIEGWLQFRTHKYKTLLKDLLEQFVLDYSMKKEVMTFIKLMRDVSVLSVPLEETLHLIYNEEGKPLLYDKNMKNKTSHYVKQYCRELLLDSSLTREDLILHILLTISPQKLILHQKVRAKEKQFIKTLEIIFDHNIEYCNGCEYCTSL